MKNRNDQPQPGIKEENGKFYIYRAGFVKDSTSHQSTSIAGGPGEIEGPFNTRDEAERRLKEINS